MKRVQPFTKRSYPRTPSNGFDDDKVDIVYCDLSDYSDSSVPGSPSTETSKPLLGNWASRSPAVHRLPSAERAKPRPRPTRRLAIALACGAFILVALGRMRPDSPTTKGLRTARCRLTGGRLGCPADVFGEWRFKEQNGELFYPAVPADPFAYSISPASPPHPIHHLIREAEDAWAAKVARQSKTLEQAVAEYERRYKQRPPRGFDAWFAFAQANDVQLLDEYDSIHERIEPFAGLSPETLRERSAMLQGAPGAEDVWLHQHTVTIHVSEKGTKLEAEGPMREVNHRADQVLALLEDFAHLLPDLNITITGHDLPWIVISGEQQEMYRKAAREKTYLDDISTHIENWDLDGWQLACPPDSPIRRAPRLSPLSQPAESSKSFVGLDHVGAMDVCHFPNNRILHGFTAWEGPRPGVLFPLFSFSTSSLNSDLLLPPLEQYERGVTNDVSWSDKTFDKALWRGTTTGGDLVAPLPRKFSQRIRLAKLPSLTGETTLPLAAHDKPDHFGPVSEITATIADLADEYLDVMFAGSPAQCGDEKMCAALAREFDFDGYMPDSTQYQYKYLIDVDGNGWSGRFHRYVPLKLDYSDLLPIMAFFRGAPEDGRGNHNHLAEKIATQGKEWAESHWRWVDMQAYLFRTLLEYARIMNRDESYTNYDLGTSD
ncbi:hypothetical protein Rhopal_001870-T1 [Rhodotorula paludigena]|uniref:Glycosyl transferase CAP10 domain-containing protein n=1 Tax=Rhodotorula paludigena TaxID=86838 RepID=A0AAV5GEF8_9BASI|nr:hypothetical protein Rhopal_001870-T1 [Rhodotorula paludigena]